jgi:DNA mismatch endonuclease (patch repair protein)
MGKTRSTPTFAGLKPASRKARRAAQGCSKKSDTRCELVLRRTLWAMGLRYRRLLRGIPGRPDIVFPRQRLVVFCDGDFWHGRDLDSRLALLARGHNASYWIEKIPTNVRRDRAISDRLGAEGWQVVRLWETDILRDPEAAAAVVAARLRAAEGEAPNE